MRPLRFCLVLLVMSISALNLGGCGKKERYVANLFIEIRAEENEYFVSGDSGLEVSLATDFGVSSDIFRPENLSVGDGVFVYQIEFLAFERDRQVLVIESPDKGKEYGFALQGIDPALETEWSPWQKADFAENSAMDISRMRDVEKSTKVATDSPYEVRFKVVPDGTY